ncbi:MAG: hypothetical protein IPN47_21125 [Gemmatimonadetes bacterium]|nr:hypothetical protein [Gemmatimonadota bacterium]
MRVNDWLVPAGEARELTRAEIEAGLYADPEVTLISDYLSKTLDDAQARDVERRLRDDEGFRTKVGPIVAAERVAHRRRHRDRGRPDGGVVEAPHAEGGAPGRRGRGSCGAAARVG